MYEYFDEMREDSFLEHHGILGQKWGIRRFQNYDGTLKAAGKRRRSEDRVQKREERKAARAEKKAAKEEKARRQVRAEIEKAIANVDMDRLSKYKGQMTDDDLAAISKRAMALGKVGENLGKYKKELPPSTFDKAVKTLGVMKTGMDAIRNAHSAWNDLKKEFGLDTESILKDAGSDGNSNSSDDGPDIFDRIKETTGKIAKDAASKANEKYQERKFKNDLQEARDRKKDSDTLDWLEKLNGGKKESSQPKAGFDSGFKLKDGDYSVFKSSSRDLNGNKEAGSAISDFMKSINGSGSKGSSGNSSVDLPPLSLPWSGSVSSKAANTKISDVPKPSPQSQRNIDRLIKKGSKTGDMSIDDIHTAQSDAIDKINKALGR